MLACALTALIRLIVYLRFMRHVRLTGDEGFYWAGAEHLLVVVGVRDGGRSEAIDAIIGRGWFMPGMSGLLAPVRLFTDDPSAGRLWIGIINLLVFFVVLKVVHHKFGTPAAWFFWAIGTFTPTVVLFSFTFWGESLAAMMTILLTLAVVTEAQRPFGKGSVVRWALIGGGFGAIIYIRASSIVLAFVIVAAIILVSLDRTSWSASFHKIWRSVLIVGISSLLVIAPWSIALSLKKDGPFLTTTSIELALIVGFGDPQVVREVAQGANPWVAWDEHITARAEREGRAYADVLSDAREEVLSTVTTEEYVDRLGRNFERLLFDETTFIDRFFTVFQAPGADSPPSVIGTSDMVGTIQELFWIGLMIVLLIDFLLFGPIRKSRVWETIVLKLAVLALFTQPFVHPTHGRYHVGFIAIFAVIAADRLFGRESRWPFVQGDRPSWRSLAGRLDDRPRTSWIEVVMAAVVIGVGLVIVVG